MSFERVHENWPGLLVLPPQYLEQLDINVSRSLDGHDGGAYSPSEALVIGGGGIMDANATTHDVASSTAEETISNVTTHRLRVTNVQNVTSKLTVQFDPAADGEKRELQVDYLTPGTQLLVQGDGGASIFNGLLWAHKPLQYIRVTLERSGGAWHLAARSASPDKASLTSTLTPQQYPAENTQLVLTEDAYAQTASGLIVMKLPDATQIGPGVGRRVLFERIEPSTRISFQQENSTTPFHIHTVNGAGEINTCFEFVSRLDAWSLMRLDRNQRFRGTRTLVTSGAPTSSFYDTDLYEDVRVTQRVSTGAFNGPMSITVMPPQFEGQELTIRFDDFASAATQASCEFKVLDDPTVFYHFSPATITGSGPLTWRLKVVDGAWRWMGASY